MRRVKALRVKALTALGLAVVLILLAVSPILSATSPTTTYSQPWTDSKTIHPISGTDGTVFKQEQSLRSVPKLDKPVSYPDVLNNITWLRYAPMDTTTGTVENYTKADAVIIAVSGMHAANDGFDTLGKSLVAKAKKDKGMNVEVWAIDRRVNNLEDVTGLNYLEELGKAGQITDLKQAAAIINNYYYDYPKGGQYKTINGKTFQGFLTDKSAPYLSEFGLRVAMEDIYTVITTMFPDQNVRKRKVYIAGDSLGAVETADFAAWDFDGNAATTTDAGYNNIAGVLALDALMTTNAIPISQDFLKMASSFIPQSLQRLINTTSLTTYAATLAMIRNGSLSVFLPTSELGYVPTTYLGAEVTAMLADAAPDAESSFYQSQPPASQLDPRTDIMLRVAMSKDLNDFLSGVIFQKRVRWTNEALLGIALDNNFNPIAMNEASMGFLSSADGKAQVEEKSFPFIGGLQKLLFSFIWNPISGFMPYAKMYIPKDAPARQTPWTGPLYTWVNYNEINNNTAESAFTRKYTTSEDEVTDLHDLAKCLYDGPSNVAEWYYTTRFFADILIAPTSGSSKYGLNLLHANDLSKVPTTIWMNNHGTNIGYAKMNGVTPTAILPGTHLDVMMMSMDKHSGNTDKKIMLWPLCDWMKKTTANVQ
jgi:hypothetical protein